MIRKTFASAPRWCCSAGAAFASRARRRSGPTRPGARMFELLDGHRDGRVTWDETWTFATTRFNRGRGRPQRRLAQRVRQSSPPAAKPSAPRPEWAQRMEQRRAGMFRALDANSDGQVTLAEMQGPGQARFRAMDANADGAVTREELPQRMHRGSRPEASPAR
jgi:Ca2+-binding EF-hand superfamily protein